MNLKKFKITSRGLYWGLIVTFGILYLCVGFVSTLHSITFFNLANTMPLAVLLGLTYEVGQASVLFSILMAKKEEPTNYLAWFLMFLLTALQVTANVYASFKFMVSGGSTDWTYWQKSILFGVQASSPEMYQVIISWISGALLPIVALGMTALVAQRLKMIGTEDEKGKPDVVEDLQHDENTSLNNKELIEKDEEVIQPNDALKAAYDRYTEANKLINLIPKEAISSTVSTPQIEIPLNYPKDKVDSGTFKPTDLLIKPELPKTVFPYTTFVTAIDNKNDNNFINEKTEIERDYLDEEVDRLMASQEFQKDFVTPNELKNLKGIEQIQKEEEQLIEALKNNNSEKVATTFQKEFIIPKPEKKRGRPPKVSAVAPKKVQEPLQKEEVKVPEKKHRVSNPLTKKGNKPQVIKHIEQINPTSKGEELIESLKDDVKPIEDNVPIEQPTVVETSSPEPLKEFNDGIEVVDVKAVPIKKK